MGGTNCHVVLAEAPAAAVAPRPGAGRRRRAGRLPVAAVRRGRPTALRAQAARLRDTLAHDPARSGRTSAYSLATDPHRLRPPRGACSALTGRRLLRAAWTPWPTATPHRTVTGRGAAGGGRSRSCSPARAPSGPGWAASCTRPYPVFAEALDEACAALDPHAGPARCATCARRRRRRGLLDRTGYTQPALFAVEVALFRLRRVVGRRGPTAWSATRSASSPRPTSPACCRLADACALVAARGRLMQALPAGGAMVAVAGHRGRGRCRCSTGRRVGIAAVNGPRPWWSPATRTRSTAVAADWRDARAARPAACRSATPSTPRRWSRCSTSSAAVAADADRSPHRAFPSSRP